MYGYGGPFRKHGDPSGRCMPTMVAAGNHLTTLLAFCYQTEFLLAPNQIEYFGVGELGFSRRFGVFFWVFFRVCAFGNLCKIRRLVLFGFVI